MPEWSTYTLSDFLMFSPRTYWRLVELYNRQFWPLHLPLLATACAACWLTASRRGPAFRLLAPGLAAAWLWVGWAFLWERYASINWAAQYVASAFVLQALWLLVCSALPGRPAGRPGAAQRGTGWLLAGAGLCYPLLGLAAGRPVVQTEIFGMAPEPTALLTLGLLLLGGQAVSGVRRALLFPVPVLVLLLGAATGWTFLN